MKLKPQNSEYHIIIADRQPFYVDGLRQHLEDLNFANVIEIALTPEELKTSLTSNSKVSLVIFDCNDLDFLSMFIGLHDSGQWNSNTVVISSDKEHADLQSVLNRGVKGYVTKLCSKEEVGQAILSVLNGNKFFCNTVLDMLIGGRFNNNDCEPTELSQREIEVTKHIALGLTNFQIGDVLNISAHTVHTHRRNVMKKLNINNVSDLVRYAIQTKII
jgi:DNA-binding NarL/FixJ family response regulator